MMGLLHPWLCRNFSDDGTALLKGITWTYLLNRSFPPNLNPASQAVLQWRESGHRRERAAHFYSRGSGGWRETPLLYCTHQTRLLSSGTWDQSEHKNRGNPELWDVAIGNRKSHSLDPAHSQLHILDWNVSAHDRSWIDENRQCVYDRKEFNKLKRKNHQ